VLIALGVTIDGTKMPLAEAQKGFRRVKGYVHMPSVVAALRPVAATVPPEKQVA
jgi:hypothetical protein